MSILALHGFTGCGDDFVPLREILRGVATGDTTKPDWHCPDLPGHGPEPQLDCSPGAILRFIDRKVGEMPTGSGRRVLLGYSMGARAGLLHALRNPEIWDALILISPNPGITDQAERSARAESDEALAKRIEAKGVPAFLRFWQEQPLIRSQRRISTDQLARMDGNRLRHQAAGLAASLREFGAASCPDLWPGLPTLNRHVLLICGEQDTKYRSITSRMERSLPKSIRCAIPEAGHAPHLERPVATAEVIKRFLDAHAPSHSPKP